MKRFLSICATLVLLVVALVACDPPLTKGYVLQKNNVPEHTYVHWHYIDHCVTIGSGKKSVQSCTTTSYSTLDTIPEEWYITLTSCNPDSKPRADCQQGSVQVSRDTYQSLHVGEYADLTNVSIW